MISYRNKINEILEYKPKHPDNRNGHDIKILYRANIVVATLRSWREDPVTEKMLRQQGFTDGIVTIGDRSYPIRLLEELENLREQYPDYFEA